MSYVSSINMHWRHSWRRQILSHAIAFAAGIAVTLMFVLRAISPPGPVSVRALPAPVNAFDDGLQAAVVRMEFDMCITPTGNADRDFARAMIPHHLGAIEMARLELLYGGDVRLRRLAQGIVVEQSQEIELMRHILNAGSTAHSTLLIP
jgi:hypothetical protein